jgi:hypothetical protein
MRRTLPVRRGASGALEAVAIETSGPQTAARRRGHGSTRQPNLIDYSSHGSPLYGGESQAKRCSLTSEPVARSTWHGRFCRGRFGLQECFCPSPWFITSPPTSKRKSGTR